MWRTYSIAGIRKKRVDSVQYIWKLPPDDNGGLLAQTFDELLSLVERALAEPDCCNVAAQSFLDRHMLGADGRSCERICNELDRLAT